MLTTILFGTPKQMLGRNLLANDSVFIWLLVIRLFIPSKIIVLFLIQCFIYFTFIFLRDRFVRIQYNAACTKR